jgi:hypothetical protein
MDLNSFESLCKTENKARLYFKKFCWQKQRIKHDFTLRNSAGKNAMFFAQRVEAIKSIEFSIKSTVVSAVDINFMTLPTDG